MPDRDNPLFRVSIEVAEEIRHRKQQVAKERPPVPFGMERVGAEQLRQRLRDLTPQGEEMRREMLQAPGGRERILALFRKKGRK